MGLVLSSYEQITISTPSKNYFLKQQQIPKHSYKEP